MTSTCLLSTTYFGPVQWYQKLCRYDRVLIEHHESYQKQTFRNRCLIATTQGVQALTVPTNLPPMGETSFKAVSGVEASPRGGRSVGAVLLSDHGNWRHLHWQALQSAYGDSPFFEYYEDDLRPFFTDHRWERLIDFNDDILRTMCRLLDIKSLLFAVHLVDERLHFKTIIDSRYVGIIALIQIWVSVDSRYPKT